MLARSPRRHPRLGRPDDGQAAEGLKLVGVRRRSTFCGGTYYDAGAGVTTATGLEPTDVLVRYARGLGDGP